MRELRFLDPYTQLHGILSPYKDGGVGGGGSLFRASGRSAFLYGQWGNSFVWGESQLGISLGGFQYQFLAQLANAGPKSIEVLTNCHREVCTIKFVASDVLTSLWQFDKCYFDKLGHLFIHWVHYWKPDFFWNVKSSSI